MRSLSQGERERENSDRAGVECEEIYFLPSIVYFESVQIRRGSSGWGSVSRIRATACATPCTVIASFEAGESDGFLFYSHTSRPGCLFVAVLAVVPTSY